MTDNKNYFVTNPEKLSGDLQFKKERNLMKNNTTRRGGFLLSLAVAAFAFTPLSTINVSAQAPKVAAKTLTLEDALKGAKPYGEGVVKAYSKAGKTLVLLPKTSFNRMFLWYAEYISVPSEVKEGSLAVGSQTIQFQLHGNKVFVRNLTPTLSKRVASEEKTDPLSGRKFTPTELSVRKANEAPVAAILPVITASESDVLVDMTSLFTTDVETISVRPVVATLGLLPIQVNPQSTYITSVRVYPKNFGVRTHLTYIGKDPKNPIATPKTLSFRIGHSLIMLPEKPMPSRLFDRRVGFFPAGNTAHSFGEYTEFGVSKSHFKSYSSIMRYKLVKKNPDAAVSDPVEPIIFYIGREVPDKWRPYLKAAVESWQPVFKEAGFSNAIIAKNAPSFKDDPNWTPEDARYSTIRWISQEFQNARGPHLVDPRSGEILSSHVEVWPGVISYFSRYFYGVMSPIEKRASKLPFDEKFQGELLKYIVAHEIGHAIGLRHNHIASTPYSVKQLRDPKFANKWGANSSIMAYGRFNQAAQPGDGVTKTIPGVGPYDFFAIKWGYGVFGKTPEEEAKALEDFTAKAQADRKLLWAAGETGGEASIWKLDPRVVTENTGSDRVEATRLGVKNIIRSLKNLDKAAGDNVEEYGKTFEVILAHHMKFLNSVTTVVGGIEASPFAQSGSYQKAISAEKQKEAVMYLLNEGAQSLDAYINEKSAGRAVIYGLEKIIARQQASLVDVLFSGTVMEQLSSQKRLDPKAYGVLEFAEDSNKAVWGNLREAPEWRRTLQRAYLKRIGTFVNGPTDAEKKALAAVKAQLTAQEYSGGLVEILTSTGEDTVFPAWARDMLPHLANRLERAADRARTEEERLHFLAMATEARRLVK